MATNEIVTILWLPCKPGSRSWVDIIDLTYNDYVDRDGDITGYMGLLEQEYEDMGHIVVWLAFTVQDYQEGYKYPIITETISLIEYCDNWGDLPTYELTESAKEYAKQN